MPVVTLGSLAADTCFRVVGYDETFTVREPTTLDDGTAAIAAIVDGETFVAFPANLDVKVFERGRLGDLKVGDRFRLYGSEHTVSSLIGDDLVEYQTSCRSWDSGSADTEVELIESEPAVTDPGVLAMFKALAERHITPWQAMRGVAQHQRLHRPHSIPPVKLDDWELP